MDAMHVKLYAQFAEMYSVNFSYDWAWLADEPPASTLHFNNHQIITIAHFNTEPYQWHQ